MRNPPSPRALDPAAGQLAGKRAQLIDRFVKGREPAFMAAHARLLDEYFLRGYEQSLVGPNLAMDRQPYAIVALGGYGRGEQCVWSDVDLLILFRKKVPRGAEELVQEMVYPLWDLGLDVGHATRSIQECLGTAAENIEVLTALLDARFVCGQSLLYTQLTADVRDKLLKRRARKVIATLVQNNLERHLRQGDSSGLLEPNLKEGQGGLRDYHTMLWIARIKSGLRQPRDLEYNGYLSHDEFRKLEASLRFTWEVRNRLHLLTGRKCDQLHFEHQTRLAREMKFKSTATQQEVERFLGRLHEAMEFVKQRLLMFLYEQGHEPSLFRRRRRSRQSHVEGLAVEGERLGFNPPEAIVRNPDLLMRIFEESARLKVPLSSEASRLVGEFRHLVTRAYRQSPDVIRSFERILESPAAPFNVLNEMLRCGFLERFVPPFSQIVNRIQYDEYHLYPVDKHSLRVVQTIKRLDTPDDTFGDPLCAQLLGELRDKHLLYWAALLHDVGKGSALSGHAEQGAVIARRYLHEVGYPPEAVDTVGFLVQEHLLLIKTATRRDITDEQTAIQCARRVRDVNRLKMLYLLTVGDCIATGPKAWHAWTATLLKSFFLRVLRTLERGELATDEAVSAVESKRREVLSRPAEGRLAETREALFQVMSPRYLLYTPAADIIAHMDLFLTLGDARFVWRVEAPPHTDVRTVTICAKDAPGIFSKIAGTFTLNGIDILAARVYTWRNNIALDIFQVKPPADRVFEAERWQRAEADLGAVLAGSLDLAAELREKIAGHRTAAPRAAVRPQKVVIDNDSSDFFTIVEVYTHDFPGLLYLVTDALFRSGLDVWVARIATQIDQVVDIFYVRDVDGNKVDTPELEAAIRDSVLEALPAPLKTDE